jgi:FXSXX-COOH protein
MNGDIALEQPRGCREPTEGLRHGDQGEDHGVLANALRRVAESAQRPSHETVAAFQNYV